MRASIVFTGFGVILFGLLLWVGFGYPIEIIGTIGLINIILGIVTPKSPGLDLQPEQAGPLKLIVDRATSRSGTYELVFSDSKLILKKLASRGGIMAVALVFAIIGGLIGGVTGYSWGACHTAEKGQDSKREQSLDDYAR